MIPSFNIQERRTIFHVLTHIMKADSVLHPAEVAFLDQAFYDLGLSVEDFDYMEDVDFDELVRFFETFTIDKKSYAKKMFFDMAQCDGYVDPREVALIDRLK